MVTLPYNQGRSGYTLVELLITMAIICMLASLLMPVFAAAFKAAGRISCSSNLRQVGSAFSLYTIDHNANIPHEDNGSSQPPFNSGWYIVLKDYINEDGIFICPLERHTPGYKSYKMNSLLETEENPFFNIATVLPPSNTVLLFDGRIDNLGVRYSSKGTWNMISSRHELFPNILFIDSHVEHVTNDFDTAGWADEGGLTWEPPK
jgi:prepilin-type N-terminal cleavage/methylation domain-containing protein